ncbi:MAG: ATP-dependent RecD-like DNA helicase, partial [Erysipelotrichaceae bacterium]|nr:ATP-dependent RecD-like DNA helicase [Erysipelotrichaceae bacterium]
MECIKGKFHTILFRNDDSGYTVRRFRLYEEEDKLMTVTGYLPQLPSDILFRLHGEYKEHPRYGMQFQIQTFERVELDDSDSLVGYLSSHTFPGIGKKMAQVLIDTLGTNILQKIQDDPDCLDSVPKMTAKKKEALIEGIRQREASDEEVLRFFTLHGVHLKQAMKLQAIYGKDMLGKLKENPYRMVEEVDGIGFQTADKFALSMGFEMDHPFRMQAACVSFVMEYCMSTGNSYIT